MSVNYAILLPEPDSYKDIVLLWARCFHTYWPDCPAKVYWTNEEETIDDDRIIPVHYGAGNPTAFCGRLLKGIEAAGTEYVLVWVADYLPSIRITNDEVETVLNYMKRKQMRYCKMAKSSPIQQMSKDYENPYFYHMDADRPYNISVTFCFFEASYLIELIQDPNWSAWQLEQHGLILSSQSKNTKCCYFDRDIGRTVHLVRKGKLYPDACKVLQKCGIDLSSVHREILSQKDVIVDKIKGVISRKCPIKLRKTIKKIGKFFGFRFATDY